MNTLPQIEKDKSEATKPMAAPGPLLRPKRRWADHSRPMLNETNQTASITFAATGRGRMPKMKRSGQPHQTWTPTQPHVAVPAEPPKQAIFEWATDFLERLADTTWATAQFRRSY